MRGMLPPELPGNASGQRAQQRWQARTQPPAPAPHQAHGCARRRRWRASSENHAFSSKLPARVAGGPSRRFNMPSQERHPVRDRLPPELSGDASDQRAQQRWQARTQPPPAPTSHQAHGCARRRRWRASSENHAFRSKLPARVAGRPSRRFNMPSQERQPCEAGCRLNCLATPATNERSNVGKRERSHLRLRLRIRHMDVPAAAGGELRVKTTLFARSSRREWQEARVADSICHHRSDSRAKRGWSG